ncbi:uncharacterized protein LAJ45_03642 [Morchella importuna]|uniref:uncharacterized protein n=1 Tax=Morchella importuna TaxID=1174673 RepID=UPI001E8E8F9E|nr:uncharacterized protein LAJ45_03642 [Morchella importuna]KAH8152216.1 hypothetical protein LAJ45_03642 [Morchella importuna]
MSAHAHCTFHFLATGQNCVICTFQNIDTFLFFATWGCDLRANIKLFKHEAKTPWWKWEKKNKLKNVTIKGRKAGMDPWWNQR